MSIIQEKLEEVTLQLGKIVEEHNSLQRQMNEKLQRYNELQGSLKTLRELEPTIAETEG